MLKTPSRRPLGAAALAWLAVAPAAQAQLQTQAQTGPYGPYGAPPPPPVPYGAAYPYPPAAPPMPVVRAPVDEYRASVDVYGSAQRLRNGNGSQSDNGGVGVRARFGLTPNLFVDGEIQGNRYDDNCDSGCYGYGYRDDNYSDLRQYRVGLGAQTRVGPLGFAAAPPQMWAKVQYTEFEIYTRSSNVYAQPNGGSYYYRDSSTSRTRGPGLHAGVRVPFTPYVAAYGQGGYVWLSGDGQRYGGPEFTGGLDVTPLPYRFDRLKIFAEYRYSDFRSRDDTNGDARLGDVRVGARIGFGR